ncbi:MAG: hypothetical protein NTW02_03865 [Cyanobium sp. LacPavin_0920_WC12_MAG_62_9]|nr:hypothetical protein [Cyanobium sp. LacPavin_0920_WC12_MAG_62_9]
MTGRERLKQLWRQLWFRLSRSRVDAKAPTATGERPGVVVLGSGRSGTSLAAGMLAKSGLFMGEVHSIRPRHSNPLGFYEDWEVNALNEQILATALPQHSEGGSDGPCQGQRWLARLPLGTPLSASPALRRNMARLLSQQPFCFKDPRFSYTLHLWRAELAPEQRQQLRCLCLFRPPAVVVDSLLKEVQSEPTLRNVALNVPQAFALWELQYRWILEQQQREGQWLFLNYDSLFETNGQRTLERFCGVSVDTTLPRQTLNRSRAQLPVPASCRQLHQQLLQLAAAGLVQWGEG